MSSIAIYRVETVEPARPPRGIADGKWCRYVLSSDQSHIVGRYRGSLSQAWRNAKMLVENLNNRKRSSKSHWRLRTRKPRTAKSKSTTH